jgi:Glycosyl transferases group 1
MSPRHRLTAARRLSTEPGTRATHVNSTDGKAIDTRALRILEIGDRGVFAAGLPTQTTLLWTGAIACPPHQATHHDFSLRAIAWLRHALAANEFDLVACHVPVYAPWSAQGVVRKLFSRNFLRAPATLIRGFGLAALPRRLDIPLALLDTEDTPSINRHALKLLDRARLYFKRELPVDHWHAFLKTAHPDLPTRRFRMLPQFRARAAKLRPISLGVPAASLAAARFHDGEKTADVFFAGAVEGSSTVRGAGLAVLRRMQQAGLRLDIPEQPLPLAEFLARCGRAWLTWSPEGYGWECFRHYEAPLAGSVPVISRPTIHRHAPLIHGEHCFHYDVEGDGLARTITQALTDQDRLRQIARAGAAHVLAHHTPRALCDYVIASVLAEREVT